MGGAGFNVCKTAQQRQGRAGSRGNNQATVTSTAKAILVPSPISTFTVLEAQMN